MYKMLIATYESKQQELVDENNSLRNSLRDLQTELQQVWIPYSFSLAYVSLSY